MSSLGNPYHKINSVFKRDNKGKMLFGEYSQPEFEYLKDNQWIWTQKVDGTSIRLSYEDSPDFRGQEHKFIGGRTNNAQIPPFLFDRLMEIMQKSPFEEVFDADSHVTLYGEGYGAKIQKGGGNYIPDGVDFVLFDVLIGSTWLERHNVQAIGDSLGIQVVPIVGQGTLDEALELAKAGFKTDVWPQAEAEGLVIRPTVELFDRRGHRIIAKTKRRDWDHED